MDEQDPRAPMSRRRFAAVAAGSALLPLAAPLRASWIHGRGEGPLATPPPGGSAQEEAPAGTDALLDYVRALYGDQLDDDDLAVVREEIASYQRASRTLRQFPLENADSPAFAFRAWRDPEGAEGRG